MGDVILWTAHKVILKEVSRYSKDIHDNFIFVSLRAENRFDISTKFSYDEKSNIFPNIWSEYF